MISSSDSVCYTIIYTYLYCTTQLAHKPTGDKLHSIIAVIWSKICTVHSVLYAEVILSFTFYSLCAAIFCFFLSLITP